MLKHEIHILALVGKEKCIIHNLLKKIARPAKLNKNGKKQYTREAVRAGKFMSAKRTWTLRKKMKQYIIFSAVFMFLLTISGVMLKIYHITLLANILMTLGLIAT